MKVSSYPPHTMIWDHLGWDSPYLFGPYSHNIVALLEVLEFVYTSLNTIFDVSKYLLIDAARVSHPLHALFD